MIDISSVLLCSGSIILIFTLTNLLLIIKKQQDEAKHKHHELEQWLDKLASDNQFYKEQDKLFWEVLHGAHEILNKKQDKQVTGKIDNV